MSINAKYRRITPQELAGFQHDPSSIAPFFGTDKLDKMPDVPDDEDFDEDAYWAEPSPVDDPERLFDLTNSWMAVHYLLTGEVTHPSQSRTPPPLVYVVMGGTPISDEDVGYGPPRFLTPEQVKEAGDALRDLAPEDLRGRFDITAYNAARGYPRMGQRGWEPEDIEPLLEEYADLRQFFIEAAGQGDALLLWSV